MRCPTLAELPPPPPERTGWPWTSETESTGPPAERSSGRRPKITIVTPSYNQGRYLEETIRSVLLQGYPNLEYILVDGGSDDGSVEIIERYEQHLAWWVSEKDKGPSHALNKGFARASGEIHAYLNSDDLYEPGALDACASAFEAGRQWVVGRVRYLEESLGTWPVPQGEASFVDWFTTCPVSQPGCFWAAALGRELGPFREDLGFFFDYEFWLRLRFVKKIQPAFIDRPTAIYRLHPDSKTVASNAEFVLEARPLRLHYQRFLSPSQQVWLSIARRHRRGRAQGARAVSLLKEGRRGEATRQLLSALTSWPLLPFDPGVLLAVRELTGGQARREGPREVWPDWDD